MSDIREITAAEFKPLVSSGKKVLIDFFFPNCGPCSMQKMILKDFAKTAEDVEIVCMCVLDAPEIAAQFEIATAPSLVYFNEGEPVQVWLGLQQKSTLQSVIG